MILVIYFLYEYNKWYNKYEDKSKSLPEKNIA